MFKIAVPTDVEIALDDAVTIISLRDKYPRCFFKTGMLKDKSTLFVLGDLTTREYGIPRQLKDGSSFYPPKDMSKFDLEQYEVNKEVREFKIQVTLSSGVKLWVKPATLEPQIYSLFSDDEPSSYSQATEYGKLAFNIYDDIQRDVDIKLTDARIKKFIKLLLTASYNLPLVVLDSLNLISINDLLNLVGAGLGVDDSVLEVKKNT